MTPERWKQIEQIFYRAMDLSEPERTKLILNACGDDAELLRELNSLLQRDRETGVLLSTLISKAAEVLPHPEQIDLIGKRIGPYQITSLIAQGGMAHVYKAIRVDAEYQKTVAVKIIRPDFAPSLLINRFWFERQILANLEHPNIARFLEGGTTDDGISYFVMEYIEGEPITDYCERHHLSIQKRLELFQKILDPVQHAHKNLVIHRDIKPGNILVTQDGVPKLLDFGIAKLLNPDVLSSVPLATVTEFRVMTPEYASPEQIRGEQVSTATDIYSLGVVLYELIAGERPYQLKSKSISEIERIICEQDPPKPSLAAFKLKIGREYARELDSIVLMAMHKQAHLRYQTAEQFANDLYRFLNGLPIRARDQTLTYRAFKFIKRHKTGVSLVALVSLLLLSFAIMMAIQASRITKERDRANEVTEFLVKAFEISTPGQARGNSVTARELLDSSAQRIEHNLKGQPDVQAAMMETIGRVYGNLGLHQTAIPLLEKSLKIRQQMLHAEHPDVASAMNYLAEALFNDGKYEVGESYARKALSIRRKQLGNHHPDVAYTLSNLGGGLYASGKYGEAESVLREALKIRQNAFGTEDAQVATSLTQLAILLHVKGQSGEAEVLNRKALAIRRKLYGNEHPEVATSLHNLGRLVLDKGDYDAAETLFREALELDRKILGPKHPDVAISISSMAYTLMEKNNLAEAEELFREALAIRREALGNQHPSVGIGLCSLSQVLIKQGTVDEVESLVQEAEMIWKERLPQDHVNHAHIPYIRAKVQMVKKNYKDAESLFYDALRIREKKHSADHNSIVNVKRSIAECLSAQGRYSEAESMFLESYKIIHKKMGAKHPDTLETANELASLYMAWGKVDQAEQWKIKTKE